MNVTRVYRQNSVALLIIYALVFVKRKTEKKLQVCNVITDGTYALSETLIVEFNDQLRTYLHFLSFASTRQLI